MSTENIAKLKLKNIQDRIDAILDSDVTPFDSVPEALEGLSDAIGGLSNILQRAISTNDEELIISASENIKKFYIHCLLLV